VRGRVLLGAVGVAMGAFGLLRFAQLDLPDVVDALVWLAGGVLLHDAVLAPLTIAATVLLRRVVPAAARARVTVALLVLVTVTVTAVPVLGRWGARADHQTVLDRDYVGGWLVLAALVMLVTLLVGPVRALVARRRTTAKGGSHAS
jgi:hypothetical protein